MRKLKAIFTAFAVYLLPAWLFGCWWIDAPMPEPAHVRVPFYINNSGGSVNLIVMAESENKIITGDDTVFYAFSHIRYEQEIKHNEILCNYEHSYEHNLSENCVGNKSFNIEDTYEAEWLFLKRYGPNEPMYFKIEFLDEPKTCLVYDGDDKVENDIRYWENYILVEKATYSHLYYYYITQEHKAMAKEEYCLL
ncbi:MAG: hypothetical protein FWC26_07345 [Fibromonadales bacterium]|nr:hypothetical protein [Fibromonadales bacterium]